MFRAIRLVSPTSNMVINSVSIDPLVVDCRKDKDQKLDLYYAGDYRHIPDLVDGGETMVLFRNEVRGFQRLASAVERAKKFDRELILIGTNEKQLQEICSRSQL